MKANKAAAMGIVLALVAGCSDSSSSLKGAAASPQTNGETTMNQSSSQKVATIVLDNAHNHAAGVDDVPAYRIPPSDALQIELRGYKIPIPVELRPLRPSVIHLICGKEEHYRTPWDGEGLTRLSSATLERVNGSSPFVGFRAGKTYLLGIGRDRPNAAGTLELEVMWATVVDVDAK